MKTDKYELRLRMDDTDKIIGLSLFDFANNVKYSGEKIIKNYKNELPLHFWINESDNIKVININQNLFNDLLDNDFRKIKNMDLIDFFKKFKIEELAL